MSQHFIAELHITHSDLPLTPTLRTVTDADIMVESQPLMYPDRSGPISFYSATDCDFETLESVFDDDHTVAEWQLSMAFPDRRIYQIYHSSAAKFTTPEIADIGIQLLSVNNSDRGWRIRLHAPDRAHLGDYWEYCREEDIQVTLEKLYSTGPRARAVGSDRPDLSLTDRQREVAHTAARMGYYEPDGASADEVAAELGISPSTLSTHLRRIMAKLFQQLFTD